MISNKSFAILGGGISGLSSAYYLMQKCIQQGINLSKIYLLEEQSRFGGWMQTRYLDDGDHNDHFELGPRTISLNSYAGINVLSLVNSLGLTNEVKHVLKQSKSFKRRYVVIDNELRLLPNSVNDLLVSKKPFKPFLFYLMNDWRQPPVCLKDQNDISVHDFFNYRFGPEVADYLINPLCIGITGGDSHHLSMKSVFSGMFQKEQTYGSVVKGMFRKEDFYKDLKQDDLVQKSVSEKWAVFSFHKGIETLPNRLSDILRKDYGSNVHLLPNSKVTGLHFKKDKSVIIETDRKGEKENIAVDHVFSSIPAIKLSTVLPKEYGTLRKTLSSIKTVHMAVVCLQYRDQILPPDKGFGFLVPSHENSKILGVTFDSCIFPSSKGTKVTVMLGGYRFKELFGMPDQVNKDEILEISLKALRSYLGITDIPIRYHVAIHQDCIPQYTVGHQDRLRTIENEIKNLNISLLGASYYGFSVPDTILNAKIQADLWMKKEIY